MASSSMSPASSSFGRLLKSSKVVSQFDPSIPLVYTTHGGSKKRSDYGLKRALPKITTAAIRVHSLDNSMTKLTDFTYAAREHSFVKGFRESNVKLAGPDQTTSLEGQRDRIKAAGQPAGACAWDKKNFQSIEDLKRKARYGDSSRYVKQDSATLSAREKQGLRALLAPASSSEAQASSSASDAAPLQSTSSQDELLPELRFPQDYLHMSEAEFNKFLVHLQKLQPKFVEYLRTSGYTGETGRILQKDILASTERPGDKLGLIDDFLAQEMPALEAESKIPLPYDPKLNHIESQQHFAYGLTYASPNLYMSDQATRALPARLLDVAIAKDDKSSAFQGGPGQPVAILGLISSVRATEAPRTPTAWHVDSSGKSNMEFGRGLARIEHAYVQPPEKQRRAESPDEVLYGVEVDEIDNPSKRPTIVDKGVVNVRVYRAGEGQGSLRPKRIGSQEWVEAKVERSRMEQAVESGNVGNIFQLSNIEPPRQGRFQNASYIPGRKIQRNPQKSDPADALLSRQFRLVFMRRCDLY